MKRSTTISAAILFVMSGFIGCNQPKPKSEGFITVDVTATYPKKELILQDFMDVEYIPLESTDSFITMAHVQDIGEDVIIVRNRNRSSDGNIFIFDKKGLSSVYSLSISLSKSAEIFLPATQVLCKASTDHQSLNVVGV